jgi:hypothetical protein
MFAALGKHRTNVQGRIVPHAWYVTAAVADLTRAVIRRRQARDLAQRQEEEDRRRAEAEQRRRDHEADPEQRIAILEARIATLEDR